MMVDVPSDMLLEGWNIDLGVAVSQQSLNQF